MADQGTLRIEVAYALPERQRVVALEVPAGTTARQAALAAGLDTEFEVDPGAAALGIYGQPVPDDHVLQAGDRVELYRPLLVDPREARRRRAQSAAGS